MLQLKKEHFERRLKCRTKIEPEVLVFNRRVKNFKNAYKTLLIAKNNACEKQKLELKNKINLLINAFKTSQTNEVNSKIKNKHWA